MPIRLAINGFGRIGRLVLRALIENGRDDLQVVAVNDLADRATMAHLLKYDSIHGRFPGRIDHDDKSMTVAGHTIQTYNEMDPSKLPWRQLHVDIVMECTGLFLTQDLCGKHILAGAKRVLMSAPAKDNSKTIVYGINHSQLTQSDNIVSNASCTTNALAPLAHILHKNYGIASGFMTTIHAYTGDQSLHDSNHRDLNRARAAALSMVPTTTGAAKAIGRVIPELDGRLDGVALRVPTPNVSAVDLSVVTNDAVTAQDVRDTFKSASEGSLKGVLGYIDDKVVSTDLNHDPHSTSFVADQVYVNDNNLLRVFAWYDNEWGFSNRMLDTAAVMGKFD